MADNRPIYEKSYTEVVKECAKLPNRTITKEQVLAIIDEARNGPMERYTSHGRHTLHREDVEDVCDEIKKKIERLNQ